MTKMTKEEFIKFFSEGGVKFDGTPLPKEVGKLPSEERLMNFEQLNELENKASGQFLKDFVACSFAGSTIPGQGKVYWVESEIWDAFYKWYERIIEINEERKRNG